MLAARKQAYIPPEEDGAWVAQPARKMVPLPVKKPNYARRFLSIVTTLVIAGCAFFLVMRFERVSQDYALNNQLKEDIRLAKQHIGDLKVELEFAIDFQRVQRLARGMGMDYPEAEQIIEIEN